MKASIVGLGLVAALVMTAVATPLLAQHVRVPAHARVAEPLRLSRTDEDGQPDTLPTLPARMTLADLRTGDAVFHGKGGCVSCHGLDATGVAGKGSSLTSGLNYIPKPYSWSGLDSLERLGISETITRANVACPARGVRGNLTDRQVGQVAAYVWAIAQTRGEPWSGGHARHK